MARAVMLDGSPSDYYVDGYRLLPEINVSNIHSGILYDWWADDIPGGTGDSFSTGWEDRIRSAVMNTQSGSPILGTQGGHKVLLTGGLARVRALSLPTTITSPATVVVVAQSTSATGDEGRLVSGPASSFLGLRVAGGTTMRATAEGGIAQGASTFNVRDNQWHSYAARRPLNGPVSGASDSGPVLKGSTVLGAMSMDSITLFSTDGSAAPTEAGSWRGAVARVTVYNRALSDVSLRAINEKNAEIFGF